MQSYLVSALALTGAALANPTIHNAAGKSFLKSRQVTDEVQDAYDFVVVGGGLAGLVMGGRLSEDEDSTVLVIEAGSDGSEYADAICMLTPFRVLKPATNWNLVSPGNAYSGNILNLWDSPLNWKYTTTPQPGLNGASMGWPRGKVLGGSSAINGLYLTRPGEAEINAWSDMLGDMDGAENWNWEAQYAAMKKSETFTPPLALIAREGGITYNAASRGTSGPLQASYPGFTVPLSGMWGPSNPAAGNPQTSDAYGGDNWGAFISTSTLDPTTWTRSYSKTAYLDSIEGTRANYDVLTNALVSKIEFDDSKSPLVAKSVEYTPDGGSTFKTVKINKEVILSAGSIGSPQVLQLSGVGPKDVLSKADVKVLYELPGVGQHLQDHPSTQMIFKSSSPTVGDQRDGNSSPQFLSYVNDCVAYPGSKILFGTSAGSVKSSISSSISAYAKNFDDKVAAGYEAIAKTNLDTIWDTEIGQVEMLMGLTYDNGSVNLQVTLQHPFSQGSVNIVSKDATDYPDIDPAYLTHDADIQIMTAGLKKIREVANSGQLGAVLTETSPGAAVTSDAQFAEFLAETLYTEFHPASTCAMLPEDQGGVVNANLIVYGTTNVRVADASVPPIEVSSHLMGGTYGLAENAADIIKTYWKNPDKKIQKNNADSTTKAAARIRGGGSRISGGDDNAGANVQVSFAHVITAAFAVVACFLFR